MTITFDQPLGPDPALDTDNWFVRLSNQAYRRDAAVAAGDAVVLTLGLAIPDPGPNVVSFSPPPFDVLAAAPSFKPAPAFSDFPLV